MSLDAGWEPGSTNRPVLCRGLKLAHRLCLCWRLKLFTQLTTGLLVT